MPLTDIVETIHTQVIDTVKATQEAVVGGVRNWTETVERVLPEEPRARLAERLPAVPDAVDRAFDLAEALIDAQYRMVARLVEMTTGADGGAAGPAAGPAAG